jgi:hypothetical protein
LLTPEKIEDKIDDKIETESKGLQENNTELQENDGRRLYGSI